MGRTPFQSCAPARTAGFHLLPTLNIVVGEFLRPASGAANTPRGGKARLRALLDQAVLERRHCTQHVKDQPPLCDRASAPGKSGSEPLFLRATRSGSGLPKILIFDKRHYGLGALGARRGETAA